jgi:hypothetical protein
MFIGLCKKELSRSEPQNKKDTERASRAREKQGKMGTPLNIFWHRQRLLTPHGRHFFFEQI